MIPLDACPPFLRGPVTEVESLRMALLATSALPALVALRSSSGALLIRPSPLPSTGSRLALFLYGHVALPLGPLVFFLFRFLVHGSGRPYTELVSPGLRGRAPSSSGACTGYLFFNYLGEVFTVA